MPTEISPGRIRRLATWYVDRGEAERQETDTIRQAELSEEFRKVLADEGVPEFIEVEFGRVMGAVFASS